MVCACEDGMPKLPQLRSSAHRATGRCCAASHLSSLPAAAFPTKPARAAQASSSPSRYAICGRKYSSRYIRYVP